MMTPLPNMRLVLLITAIYFTCNALAFGGKNPSKTSDSSHSVALDYGTVIGKSSSDGSVNLWLGIPYAAPPIGALRFKPPTAPRNLGFNFQATSYGNWCPQNPMVSVIKQPTGNQSEDCLTLNVFVSASANSSSSLPVMVFIHGGSYNSGSGALDAYNGTNLVMNSPIPIIVITFNYRLGALGYLAGKELLDEGSTNAGMLDQAAVFTWVKRYIPAFGGNASSITAFGESAGAESIGAHLIAYGGNQTLFNRAIMESGSTLSGPLPNATSNASQATFNAVASNVNCSQYNTGSEKLSCMRRVPWQSMYNAQAAYQASINSAKSVEIFSPVVDGKYIIKKPTVAVVQRSFSRTPVIIGTNTNDGTIFVPILVDAAQELYNASFALKQFVSGFANLSAESASQVLALYPLNSYNNSAVAAAAEIFADLAFTCPMLNLSSAMTSVGVPVYRYRFNQLLQEAFPLWSRNGVFHSSELPFVFATGIASSEVPLAQTIIGFWTRFAASGNPNPYNDNATWPMYSPGGPAIVLQSSTLPQLSTESDPNKTAQCAFWNSPSIQYLVDH